MADSTIKIAGRSIGRGHPPYVIAEMSGNHNGDINRAFRLIEAAKEAGADAVKLQTYTADTVTIDHDGPGFRLKGGLWDGRTLYDLYQEAFTPWEWHPALFEKGREVGITVFSSPLDATAVDFLEELGCPAYKIPSFEIVDTGLIEKAASTGKPVIISTGMANEEEIADAVAAARRANAGSVALLHCTSGYPTPVAESNLQNIPDMAKRFGVVVGLSDHTHGVVVPIAGTALGMAIVEKHFTLRRADGGPDAAFSLEPEELKALVDGCRSSWEALGHAGYEPAPSEAENRKLRRSLYVVKDVAAGEAFTAENVRSIRPGFGMPPKHLADVIGRTASRPVRRGEPLTPGMVDPKPAAK